MDEQHSMDGKRAIIDLFSYICTTFVDKKSDSKYRRYVAALDKCLQSFESVNEWADVISFLSRLGKVLFFDITIVILFSLYFVGF